MRTFVCLAMLVLLAGSAAAQTGTAQLPSLRRRVSPSPSPVPSPSPKPAALNATANATAAPAEEPAANATEVDAPVTAPAPGAKRNATASSGAAKIKAVYDSPAAAVARLPELKELGSLIEASPAVSKLLSNKNLVATIFAPNNDAVAAALKYVDSNFPNMTTKELAEMGIIDALLQYHVTDAGAVTADKVKNGMKLTMLNGENATIVVKEAAGGARHLLQEGVFIRSNTNQTVPIVDTNYQGGKAIIHIIDGVLIPESLAANYSMTDIPGASNETLEEPATADNETATEPAANGTAAAAPAPAAKSSAGLAVASMLAAPALLAVLML